MRSTRHKPTLHRTHHPRRPATDYFLFLSLFVANLLCVCGVLAGGSVALTAAEPESFILQDESDVNSSAAAAPSAIATSGGSTHASIPIPPSNAPPAINAPANASLTLTPPPRVAAPIINTKAPEQPPNQPQAVTPTTTAIVTKTVVAPASTKTVVALGSPTIKPPSPTATTGAPRRMPAQLPTTKDNRTYEVYIPAATKPHQEYHYSCEFDAAWVVLRTYGINASVDEQMKIVGIDTSIEPYVRNTPQGTIIYGGDISKYWSGGFENYLARMSGQAMRKVFEYFKLKVAPVRDRAGIEKALRAGQLVWIKTTADFKPGKPATWVMPDGRTYQTVLGNDHAVTVIGFNQEGVVIRDVLGPTNTNWNRKYEYFVDWDKFLTIWAQQSNDGLAVAPPGG